MRLPYDPPAPAPAPRAEETPARIGWLEIRLSVSDVTAPDSLYAALVAETGGPATWLAEMDADRQMRASLLLVESPLTGTWTGMESREVAGTEPFPVVFLFPVRIDGPVTVSTDQKLMDCFLREVLYQCDQGGCDHWHAGLLIGGVMAPNGSVYARLSVLSPFGCAVLFLPASRVRPLAGVQLLD